MNWNGKRVLVTGGSEGIGQAIAQAFADRGAKIGLMARRPEPLLAAAKQMGAMGFPGDVASAADVKKTVAAFVKEYGGIDVLINNAGMGYFEPLVDIDQGRFERLMAVNVTGAMLMAREVAPHFIKQKSGELVNISSTAGLKGFGRGTTYVASKFALKGMNECWRDELRRHNVRVTLVNPSEVQTAFGGREPGEMNPKKLTAKEIADALLGVLSVDPRGFVPEFAVFATNPFED